MTVSTKTLNVILHNRTSQEFEQLGIVFSAGENLLEILLANKIGIGHSCGGNGTCTTCRVFVTKNLGMLSERTELEQERAEERDFLPEERLACQTTVYDDLSITVLV